MNYTESPSDCHNREELSQPIHWYTVISRVKSQSERVSRVLCVWSLWLWGTVAKSTVFMMNDRSQCCESVGHNVSLNAATQLSPPSGRALQGAEVKAILLWLGVEGGACVWLCEADKCLPQYWAPLREMVLIKFKQQHKEKLKYAKTLRHFFSAYARQKYM